MDRILFNLDDTDLDLRDIHLNVNHSTTSNAGNVEDGV